MAAAMAGLGPSAPLRGPAGFLVFLWVRCRLAQLAVTQRERLKEAQTSMTSLPPPGGPADMLAARRSNEIVDQALASGVWTDADSSALLQVAPRLSERQREGLLNKIFGAINNQELKPVGSLPSL